MQLLTPANIIANTSSRTIINVDDIVEANTLFMDAKSSARLLAQHSQQYLM